MCPNVNSKFSLTHVVGSLVRASMNCCAIFRFPVHISSTQSNAGMMKYLRTVQPFALESFSQKLDPILESSTKFI